LASAKLTTRTVKTAEIFMVLLFVHRKNKKEMRLDEHKDPDVEVQQDASRAKEVRASKKRPEEATRIGKRGESSHPPSDAPSRILLKIHHPSSCQPTYISFFVSLQ
jgi:hypothetical protein